MIEVCRRVHITIIIVVKATHCSALRAHVDTTVAVTGVFLDVLFVVDEGLQDSQCALEQLKKLL